MMSESGRKGHKRKGGYKAKGIKENLGKVQRDYLIQKLIEGRIYVFDFEATNTLSVENFRKLRAGGAGVCPDEFMLKKNYRQFTTNVKNNINGWLNKASEEDKMKVQNRPRRLTENN